MAEAAKGNMPLAVLGRSGLVVSRLAYGAWVSFGIQLDVDKSALSSEAESEGAYQLMVHAFKGNSVVIFAFSNSLFTLIGIRVKIT